MTALRTIARGWSCSLIDHNPYRIGLTHYRPVDCADEPTARLASARIHRVALCGTVHECGPFVVGDADAECEFQVAASVVAGPEPCRIACHCCSAIRVLRLT